QLMDKAIIPFNQKSLEKLADIQDIVNQLGSCLGKVREAARFWERNFSCLKQKMEATADANNNSIKYMRDQFSIYKEKHKDEKDEVVEDEVDKGKSKDKNKGKDK
ncbi:hypothetical protein KI387_040339, partial [Taxus chinensis]